MELSLSQMKTIEHQFDSFSKKILRGEREDISRALKRKKANEILFSEMSQAEFNSLATTDKYRVEMYKFIACGVEFVIEDDLLAKALAKLPDKGRNIVLLSYFKGMADTEIANQLHMVQQTVQYQRTKSLDKLRKYMGG